MPVRRVDPKGRTGPIISFVAGLRQGRDIGGKFAEGKVFSMAFKGFERYLQPQTNLVNRIVEDALYTFASTELKEHFRKHAPHKTVEDGEAQNVEGHLRDNMIPRAGGARFSLEAPWWAQMTLGRPFNVYPQEGKVLRIQLHGGAVIFRPMAGPATGSRWKRHDYRADYEGYSASERMTWPQRANKKLEDGGIYGSLAAKITEASVLASYGDRVGAQAAMQEIVTGSYIKARLQGRV